ncbi:MAG: aldo/keto reductase [Planctomycetes bacterium]|nr:aldo/keto reductase [Planctomycetota bacterium]
MKRREFLKAMAAAGAAAELMETLNLAAGASGKHPHAEETTKDGMRYRTLGRTGEKVSLVGLGGYHIGVQKNEQESIKIIRSAIDHGINFLDNCWDYNDGQSEIRMGQALRDGYRQKVFLMTKIDGRNRESAARQIDESLRRLQTDHVDLMQFHEIIRLEDPDRIFAEGGAMEAMQAAKKAGKVRYIGFTGHKDPLVHLRMLDIAAKHDFHFDAAQMPLNLMDAHFRSFAHLVVPRLVKEGIGVLGMKSMGGSVILESRTVTAVECLHYAMSLPTSTVITGMDGLDILKQALEAVRTFRPLTQEQLTALLEKTAEAAANGRYELFKTTSHFDGTAQHPQWLG